MRSFAVSMNRSDRSVPKPFLFVRKAAMTALPVPTIGSKTLSRVLENSFINSSIKVSGNLAGCKISFFFLGGGLGIVQAGTTSQSLESESRRLSWVARAVGLESPLACIKRQ